MSYFEDDEEDEEELKKKEPWRKSLDYPSEQDIWSSFAPPGSFQEQQLRLDEIDDLVNDREYGRAKCLLDEMTPYHGVNEAEHSFQLARCHALSNIKGASLDTALYEIENALRLDPNHERYKDRKDLILGKIKQRREKRIVTGIAVFTLTGLAGAFSYIIYNISSLLYNHFCQ